jgi:hypothetical protein
LISSNKSANEQAALFRVVKWLRLHRFFNKKWTLRSFPLWASAHGYVTPEERSLFLDMVGGHSDHYLQWALKALSNWSGEGAGSGTEVLHLHGELDKTFPVSRIQSAFYQNTS